MKLPALLLYFAVCLSALGTGCGRGIVPISAPTISFSANSSSITAGQTSTLSWAVANATSVQIDNSIGAVQSSGSMTVSPTKTTTYTLTASGAGGTSSATAMVSVNAAPPTVTIAASPQSVTSGASVTLTVTATNATQVVVTNNVDSTSNTLPPSGGTLTVTPKATTTYTATATAANAQTVSANTTVSVTQPRDITQIKHVIFMMQENRSFDSYFGMLNPYRKMNGWNVGDDGKEYDVDGIEDKLTKIPNPDDEGDPPFNLFKTSSSCLDDMTSAWEESFGDVNRYDFSTTRSILMNGFVHNAEGYAKYNLSVGAPSSEFTDTVGRRAMAYYDQDFLNYYYFMASQFAVSDRWFTPIASKTVPNRIAVMSGGTTQGLVRDPSNDDHFGLQNIPTIFQELDQAGVSWKIYYSVTDDSCPAGKDDCTHTPNPFPATTFAYFPYSQNFLYQNPGGGACTGNTTGSNAVGDTSNSFCIDVSHIAPLTQYFTDLQNNALPSFAFIEPGYGFNDEHPGAQQPIMLGQQEVSQIVGALISSSSWSNSVFFLAYDEGSPFDHVPPVPGHTNDNTDASLMITSDISSIAVNPDQFGPCLANGSVHCDLKAGEPGATSTDAAAQQGFAAQLGFRVPNIVISPFTRKHYVSHAPMDHTAIIKFVESRFIGSGAHLTNRDAAQPNLLDFFDFTNSPWLTPPSSIPTPADTGSTCHASSME